MSAPDVLLDLELKMTAQPLKIERASWLRAADALLQEPDGRLVPRAAEIGIRICQKLYAQARSLDALPVALSVFQRVNSLGDTKLSHQAAVACGLLSSDSADFASALEFHGQALEIMRQLNDSAGVARSWNNIGSALCGVGRYELASASFQHALNDLAAIEGPLYARYGALTNLAQCAVHAGDIDDGIAAATLALKEMESGRNDFRVEPFHELLLRRNMIRLFVARGDLGFAAEQAEIAKQLAKQDGGIRASIAAATSQAVVDIAFGRIDIAATRLDQCLAAARPVLPALRDTLACMVRADEAVGNSARALVRLQELSDLVHDAGAQAAKAHMEMSDWRESIRGSALPADLAQTKARLVRRRGPASVPATWPTLIRLALGNALQIDASAAHGTRVGALSRLLAEACGLGPIQALEIGLAAQLHDVGIAADHENLLGHLGGKLEGPGAEEDFGHCEAGWRILCEDVHPRVLLARQIARYHHAWVNGAGHPGGLMGQSIPLHARICAVADAYDNIMRWDGFGSANTIAGGLTRLRALSGTRLDPELVDLFVDALQDETRNEGIEFEAPHGLSSFHQLINSLSRDALMKNEINGMHPNISDTEKKLLQLLVTGASSKSIAEQMGLKDGTTRVYLHSLYKRIGVHNKTSAVTWYLDREQDASLALAAVVAAAETFGDRAVHGDLLSALGIMEVFLGPYGRMWDMLTRLDGDPAQPQRGSAIRTRSRKLWNALVRGDFGAAAAFFDREGIAKSFIESPSDAVVLATALLLGGYTARATKAMSCLKVRRGASIGITVDEKAALSAIDDFINERAAENALAGLHRLADRSARRPVFRHLLIVALFHMYKIRGDSSRATDVGNAIWVEAESARNHLQSMGDRTCPMEARLPTAPRIPKADLAKYLARLTA